MNKNFKSLIVAVILVVVGFLLGAYLTQKDNTDSPNYGILCANSGGQWSAEFKECLGIDAVTCQNIGGVFNECASACRNDPKAEICTMQCVQVCDVK